MGVFATEFWRRGLRPVKGSRIVLPFPVARGRALVFPALCAGLAPIAVRYLLWPQGRSLSPLDICSCTLPSPPVNYLIPENVDDW